MVSLTKICLGVTEKTYFHVLIKLALILMSVHLLFTGKNGEPEPEPEAEQMTIDLTSASKARDALEKLLTGTMSEEESMQIAMLLAQNLQTDVELAQNTGLISEIIPSSSAQGDTRMLAGSGNVGMDISLTPHLVMSSGLDSVPVNDPAMLAMQTSSLNDGAGLGAAHAGAQTSLHQQQQSQLLHPHQAGLTQQLFSTVASSMPGSYGHHDSLKLNAAAPLHHIHQQILSSPSTTSASSLDGVPSVFTADLNAIYGHTENLPRSHLPAEQNSGLNLSHITGLESFSPSSAKTVICHLPSASQSLTSVAGAGTQNLYSGSAHLGYPPEMVASSLAPQVNFEHTRSIVNLETSVTTEGYSAPPLPVISSQSRLETGHSYQNLSSLSSSSSSSSSSDVSETLSLSLPSHSKRAKLMTSSKPQAVIPHQPHQQQLHQPHQQQLHQLHQQSVLQHQVRPQSAQQSVQHILHSAPSSQNRILTMPDTVKSLRSADLLATSPKPQMAAAVKSAGAAGPSLSARRLPLPGVETLQHRDSLKTGFSLASLHASDSSKIKFQTANVASSHDFSQTRKAVPDSSQQDVNSLIPTASPFSSAHSGSKSVNTVRYSLTAENSLTPSASLTKTICHNLLTSPSVPTTESILVTVRQPSPLESVPTTVKHTLPDTLSTPITLPSPPSLHIPPSSLSSAASHEIKDLNQEPRLPQTNIISHSSASLHSGLQHPQWPPTNPSINLQNGLPFVSATSRSQLSNKLNPAGQGSIKNKQSNAAAEAARISALASAAGVPVVCSQVSLPGFVQGVSATTFKSGGSS